MGRESLFRDYLAFGCTDLFLIGLTRRALDGRGFVSPCFFGDVVM